MKCDQNKQHFRICPTSSSNGSSSSQYQAGQLTLPPFTPSTQEKCIHWATEILITKLNSEFGSELPSSQDKNQKLSCALLIQQENKLIQRETLLLVLRGIIYTSHPRPTQRKIKGKEHMKESLNSHLWFYFKLTYRNLLQVCLC